MGSLPRVGISRYLRNDDVGVGDQLKLAPTASPLQGMLDGTVCARLQIG